MALLEAQGLTKTFGRRKVVDGVSVALNSGEIIGLLGPNGAGKTTSFKMIVGMVLPDSGSVLLRGENVTRQATYLRARRGMGYLSQEPSIFQRLTVEENLLAVLEIRGLTGSPSRDKAQSLLTEFGLQKLSPQKAFTLSGGERRRLEICRALACEPTVLLLDEPFSGVDPKSVSELQDLIRDLKRRGIGVLLTDHNVRETLNVTDRSYIINQGLILAEGLPADLVQNPAVRAAYLGERFTM